VLQFHLGQNALQAPFAQAITTGAVPPEDTLSPMGAPWAANCEYWWIDTNVFRDRVPSDYPPIFVSGEDCDPAAGEESENACRVLRSAPEGVVQRTNTATPVWVAGPPSEGNAQFWHVEAHPMWIGFRIKDDDGVKTITEMLFERKIIADASNADYWPASPTGFSLAYSGYQVGGDPEEYQHSSLSLS